MDRNNVSQATSGNNPVSCWQAGPQEQEQLSAQVLELLACGAPLSEVLGALAIGVTQLQPGVRCAVLLIEPQPNGASSCLRVGAATGLPDFFWPPWMAYPWEKVAGAVALRRSPLKV